MGEQQRVAEEDVAGAGGDRVGRRRQLEYSTEKKSFCPLTVEIFGKLIGFQVKCFFITPRKKLRLHPEWGPVISARASRLRRPTKVK